MTRPHWVLKEAYILTWRRSLDPSFKVYYALLDDVQPEELATHGFDPAHLGLIQRLHARDAAGIADEVRQHAPAASVGAMTPFEELSQKLALHLPADPGSLELLVRRLAAPPLPWWPAKQAPHVKRIAARILAGHLGTYGGLVALINELRSMKVPSESLKTVLRWLAPYWLAPEATGRLAMVVEDLWVRGSGGWAALNGNLVAKYTASRFVERVRPFGFDCCVAAIEGGADRHDADYYTDQICEWMREHDNDGLVPRDRAGAIQHINIQPPFLFVLVPSLDAQTQDALRVRFPKVVFLVATGSTLTSGGRQGTILPLKPPVDLAREQAEYGEWVGARRALL